MIQRNFNHSKGITLIELLTVIAIMVVLMALLIPQLRMVTKDRAAREAARVVGSTFVDASHKARSDGFAGIVIARNQNVVREDTGGNNIFYAGYEMYQLRQPPSYIGNATGDTAAVVIGNAINGIGVGFMEVTFPRSLDPTVMPTVPAPSYSGFLRLNGSKTLFPILGPGPNDTVGGPDVSVLCQIPSHLETPAAFAAAPFEVVRQPILRQTSLIDLPKGHMINLNYSGPIDFADADGDNWTWTAFSQSVPAAFQTEAIYIIFDDQGGIDRIYPYGVSGPVFIPDGSVHFCISTDEVKHSYQSGALSDSMLSDNPTDVLDEGSTMWISINHINGSVVVTDNAPPATEFVASDLADPVSLAAKKSTRFLEALSITGKRQVSEQ